MNRQTHFALEVKGAGTLLDMFVTEAKSYFPNATIYDQSTSTTAARHREARLGMSGTLHASQQPGTQRLVQHLATPVDAAITVTFTHLGTTEQIVLSGNGRRQILRHNMTGATMHATNQFIQQVLRAIKNHR